MPCTARAWLALALLSLAWSFFDPLWLRARRHAARARPLRRRPATRRAWLVRLSLSFVASATPRVAPGLMCESGLGSSSQALQLAQYLCRLALVGLLTLGSPHGDDNHNGGGGGGMGVGSLASSLSFASLLVRPDRSATDAYVSACSDTVHVASWRHTDLSSVGRGPCLRAPDARCAPSRLSRRSSDSSLSLLHRQQQRRRRRRRHSTSTASDD